MASDGGGEPPHSEPDASQQNAGDKPADVAASGTPQKPNCDSKTADNPTNNPNYDRIISAGTLFVLFLTFLAALFAGLEADRLVIETRKAIRHSDLAARIQHEDTLAALQKAEDANATAKAATNRQSADTETALGLSRTSTDATTKAAEAATRAVDANIASERARLFIGGVTFIRSGEKDPNPKLTFQIVNLGKTGALITGLSDECAIVPMIIPPTPSYNPQHFYPAMDVVGGGTVFTPPHGYECILDNPLTDDDFAELAAQHKMILLKGFANFQDVFSQVFTKHFGLYSYGKDGGFFALHGIHSAYNDETRDQEK
jgi:hypothetical protein